MKKIFFALAVLCSVSACTKHDPFDALLGDVWILSRFAPESMIRITAGFVRVNENEVVVCAEV